MSACVIICDCPIARHKHGTRIMYLRHKCKGAPCLKANNDYERNRSRQRGYGREADRVDATPVREHIKWLKDEGLSYRQLSKVSGVSERTIFVIVNGNQLRGNPPTQRVLPRTEKAILAIQPTLDNKAAGRLVDPTGTRRRIRALMAIGLSLETIAEHMGLEKTNLFSSLTRESVTAGTARAVRDAYEKLWDQLPEASNNYEHAWITRRKNYAIIHGWLPPMAWDDDEIDNPEYRPVLTVGVGSKVDAKREAFLEEVEFFADAGERIEGVSRALGMNEQTVGKRLERYGRTDLLNIIGYASSKKSAANPLQKINELENKN